jgi:MFS family permease
MHDTIGTSTRNTATRGVSFARSSLIVFGAGQSAAFIALPIVFRELDMSESAAGIVFGVASAVSMLAAPILGRKSDAVGRRTILAVCLGAYGLATMLFGLALYHSTRAALPVAVIIAGLLAIRMIAGGAGSGIYPSCQGYVADMFEPRRRLRESGRLSATMNLGLLTGSLLISGLGLLVWSVEAALLIVGALALLLALAIWNGFPEAPRAAAGKPRRITSRDPRIRGAVIFCVAFVSAQAIVQQMLGFLVQDRLAVGGSAAGAWTGICFAAAVVASMVSQAMLVSRVSGRLVLPLAFMVAGGGLFLASRAVVGVELAGAMFLVGLAFGFVFPTLMGIASTRVAREEQGGVAGIMASMSAFGLAIGPICGGVLYDLVGSLVYTVAAALMAVLAVAALLHKPAPQPA